MRPKYIQLIKFSFRSFYIRVLLTRWTETSLSRALLLRFKQIFRSTLLQLRALSSLISLAALKNARDNLASVHMLESVAIDLAEDTHLLRPGVGVVGQGDESGGSVVDDVGSAEWQSLEVRLARHKGGGKDDSVDVLKKGLEALAWT